MEPGGDGPTRRRSVTNWAGEDQEEGLTLRLFED
jgi:hypothetical protein